MEDENKDLMDKYRSGKVFIIGLIVIMILVLLLGTNVGYIKYVHKSVPASNCTNCYVLASESGTKKLYLDETLATIFRISSIWDDIVYAREDGTVVTYREYCLKEEVICEVYLFGNQVMIDGKFEI